jgi:hypothetical protein
MYTNVFFVTGMIRSGTTLLASLVSQMKEVRCLSDQNFEVFLDAKRKFLSSLRIEEYHLLSHYFPVKYHPVELCRFLENTHFAESYSESLPDTGNAAGRKEVLCEEFIPFFLKKGVKVIQIIRDPRDVIASIHLGRGSEFAGAHRPVLFDLRNWRKSVAFAIEAEGHPCFRMVKYEDLVQNPEDEIRKLADFLQTDYDYQASSGDKIPENSSFDFHNRGIYKSAIGTGIRLLPVELIKFTESVCFPEMVWLGYPVSENKQDFSQIIQSFSDPFIITRKEFSDFNYPFEKKLEITRLEYLNSMQPVETELFVSKKVEDVLRLCCVKI